MTYVMKIRGMCGLQMTVKRQVQAGAAECASRSFCVMRAWNVVPNTTERIIIFRTTDYNKGHFFTRLRILLLYSVSEDKLHHNCGVIFILGKLKFAAWGVNVGYIASSKHPIIFLKM